MGQVTKNTMLAITFIVAALVLFGVLAYFQASHGGPVTWGFWALCCVCAVFVVINVIQTGGTKAVAKPPPSSPPPERSPEPRPSSKAAHPYRSRLTRVFRRTVPPVSGTTTALIVGSCMLLTTILVPLALKKPIWIEGEIVLLVWWGVGVVTLTTLLWKGKRVADDRWKGGWPWYRDEPKKLPVKADAPGDKTKALGCFDAVGCLVCTEALGIGIVLALAFGAAWLLVELLLPAVFLVVYYLVVKVFGRVLRDWHDCKGRFGRSLFFATLWSTLYVAPLLALVWLIGFARGM